jgi:uncharacterized protein YndB with AHSA1/START domain
LRWLPRTRAVADQSTDPIHLDFEIACPPDHAFRTWAERTSLWWPSSHTVTTETGLEIIFEPFVGGRIFERTAAGVEHDWGCIVAWEPPDRLVYEWHLRVDRSDATEVEIRFSTSATGTRVTIEHRGWERLGAAKGVERRQGNFAGWGSLLPHFVEFIAAERASI